VLKFKNLGSGSTGNASVIEAQCGLQTTRILIDCGLGLKELERRLIQAELELTDLDALFITHEHADHVGHTRRVAGALGIPVWMSQGTWLACNGLDWGLDSSQINIARDTQIINIGSIEITPFTVPHDAREPLQVKLSDGSVSMGLLTDLGHISSHVLSHLKGCNALLMETNHDTQMLRNSGYPQFLKDRISGPLGHLSNDSACELARKLNHTGLGHVVAAHLSERNNSPEIVLECLSKALGRSQDEVWVASPVTGSAWVTVN
jgi:phosphoribosyl 1,2-cyclic phosphodiesterase